MDHACHNKYISTLQHTTTHLGILSSRDQNRSYTAEHPTEAVTGTQRSPKPHDTNSGSGWFGGSPRNSVDRFDVGNIDPDSHEVGIRSYLRDQEFYVTYLRLMRSQRDDFLSAQVNIAATNTTYRPLELGFWSRAFTVENGSQGLNGLAANLHIYPGKVT